MGFSVSGSAAIIFLSTFIAFGMLYTAADNSVHELIDAQDDRSDGTLETKNTQIEVVNATYDDVDNEVTITANNTGATDLSLEATTLLLDNTVKQGWQENATVDGDSETDLWLPGETLTITVNADSTPDRVSLTTGSGVSATTEVTA